MKIWVLVFATTFLDGGDAGENEFIVTAEASLDCAIYQTREAAMARWEKTNGIVFETTPEAIKDFLPRADIHITEKGKDTGVVEHPIDCDLRQSWDNEVHTGCSVMSYVDISVIPHTDGFCGRKKDHPCVLFGPEDRRWLRKLDKHFGGSTQCI